VVINVSGPTTVSRSLSENGHPVIAPAMFASARRVDESVARIRLASLKSAHGDSRWLRLTREIDSSEVGCLIRNCSGLHC